MSLLFPQDTCRAYPMIRFVGYVKQVQVQAESLKVGRRPDSRYDPAPLRVVARLRLTAHGAVGEMVDGGQIIDVHNAAHPASRNRGGNDVSVVFTGHYAAMRARFGPHLSDGSAGENILVEAEQGTVALGDLGARLVFENPGTGERVVLAGLHVAAPCVEFGGFAAGAPLPGEQMKDVLRFLHDGTRGFYAALSEPADGGVVQPGDLVYADEGAAEV